MKGGEREEFDKQERTYLVSAAHVLGSLLEPLCGLQ